MSETMRLESLKNVSRPFKKTKLLGRGPGCKKGKTCGRGHKGSGSRSGYKIRAGKEGGGVPLFRRIPTKGFTRGLFQEKMHVINLDTLDKLFQAGDTVSLATLKEKGFIRGSSHGVKVLGRGNLTKKLNFDACAFSSSAKEKLKM